MDAAVATPIAADPPRTETLADEARQLFRLGWPLALAQGGQALLGVVDTAVVGRLSAQAQGAVGLGNGLFFGIAVLGVGGMMALDPLVSQAIGSGDPARARSHFWQGVWFALIASAVLAVPIALAPLLLTTFGVDAPLARETGHYVWARLPQLPVLLLFVVSRSWLQCVGRTPVLFIATIVANVLNFVLCVVFVFPLGLGVAGAALATVLAGAVQLVIVLKAIGKAPEGTSRKLDPLALGKTVRVGAPIGLSMFAEVGVFTVVGIIAGAMGEASIAAHQIAITWASFTFCLAVGVGSAAAVRVGWAIGAGDTPAARRSGFAALGLGVVIMSTSALFFFTLPLLPARAMSSRPDVIAVVVGLLAVCSVFQIFDGIQAVAAGALRGAGDTRWAFWANVVGHYGVGLPIALLCGLKLGMGVVGLWWGLCAGLIAVAIGLFLRFHVLTRRHVAAL